MVLNHKQQSATMLAASVAAALLVLVCSSNIVGAADPANGLYNLGVGISDITGPAAGVNLVRKMGHGLVKSFLSTSSS